MLSTVGHRRGPQTSSALLSSALLYHVYFYADANAPFFTGQFLNVEIIVSTGNCGAKTVKYEGKSHSRRDHGLLFMIKHESYKIIIQPTCFEIIIFEFLYTRVL